MPWQAEEYLGPDAEDVDGHFIHRDQNALTAWMKIWNTLRFHLEGNF